MLSWVFKRVRLIISAPPSSQILGETVWVDTNKSESTRINLPTEPGRYAFISSFPGHVDLFTGYIEIESPEEDNETEDEL